jgi:hypothetical protein
MYLLNEDDLAEWPRGRDENWPFPPIIIPGGGGPPPTEDEVIADEIKRGTSVNDLTNKLFWSRHPEFRDCRLPRSCQELEQLQREWSLINGKVTAKKSQGGRTNPPKAR